MSFKSFQFHPQIESGIGSFGYTAPTPIQLQCIPLIRQGKDVMGLAQTGTGKTAAFALPILQRLMAGPKRRLRSLIIAPTRELAEQIHEAFSRLGGYTRLKSVAIYGGVSKGSQIKKLREGAEIAVACPGRLLDLMAQKEVSLADVEVLVLDEADRMFDMGFLPDIRRIVGRIPVRRQTLLFSATMPKDIRDLAQEVLHDPVTVRIGDSVPVSTVSHAVFRVEPHLKTALLMKLLDRTKTDSVLIFTRTKHRATRLANRMKQAGLPVASLQGDLSQQQRQKAISGFRNGRYQILVATDIAARGIDVSRISHVINYDTPDTIDAYTHRIGRTGRAARTGDAYTLVTPKDRSLVRDIENVLGEKMERRTIEGFDYNMPAPECSGEFGRSFIGGARRDLTRFRTPPRARRSAGLTPQGGPAPGAAYRGAEDGSKGKVLFSSSRVKARRSWTTRSF
jgi:ATP-dependent RNA helicase RhlE